MDIHGFYMCTGDSRAIRERGEWNATAPKNMFSMRELTMGILGFGAIPRLIAKRLIGFDARVIAYALRLKPL